MCNYNGFLMNRCVFVDNVATNRWHSVEISQLLSVGRVYTYEVKFNHEIILSVVNTSPREFTNVEVYSGNPEQEGVHGRLQKLVIDLSPDGKFPGMC